MTADTMDVAIARACADSAVQHSRLCPRQVLGVRVGLAAGQALDLAPPRTDKRVLLFVETDGCFVDGISAATGCTVGHRTMRIVDYGRVAVTCIDLENRRAFRIAPRLGVRDVAARYADQGLHRYETQLQGYQRMPEDELLAVTPVRLTLDIDALLGRPGVRVDCARCGEEVLNGREEAVLGEPVCPACRTPAYYEACGEAGVAGGVGPRGLGR